MLWAHTFAAIFRRRGHVSLNISQINSSLSLLIGTASGLTLINYNQLFETEGLGKPIIRMSTLGTLAFIVNAFFFFEHKAKYLRDSE